MIRELDTIELIGCAYEATFLFSGHKVIFKGLTLT